MKFNIYSLLTPFNLNPGAPVPQNREPHPISEEPALPKIDYSLLASVVQSADETGRPARTRFTKAAGANA
jgi:hypothetical protein